MVVEYDTSAVAPVFYGATTAGHVHEQVSHDHTVDGKKMVPVFPLQMVAVDQTVKWWAQTALAGGRRIDIVGEGSVPYMERTCSGSWLMSKASRALGDVIISKARSWKESIAARLPE